MATSNKAAPAAFDNASGATVHDVARVAGVSAMTVSRVINGRASVSAATRGKVEAAIASLHYQPNLAARAARSFFRSAEICTRMELPKPSAPLSHTCSSSSSWLTGRP